MSFLEMCSVRYPLKYPCGTCSAEVYDDQKAVQCESDSCMCGHMKSIIRCLTQKSLGIPKV